MYLTVESDNGSNVVLSKRGVHVENNNLTNFINELKSNEVFKFEVKQNEIKNERKDPIVVASKIRKLNFGLQPSILK